MSKVRVECNCKICKANAAKMGRTAPLAAFVPAPLAAAVKGQFHGLVYDAHNPDAMGAAVRKAAGIEAA